MKLRNKKTGEIMDDVQYRNYSLSDGFGFRMNGKEWEYHSLAELNEDWEDYEEPKQHWFIATDGRVLECNEDASWSGEKSIGNYFDTKEEAEKAVEKLRALKRLRDKGFRFNTWYGGSKNISYEITSLENEMYIPREIGDDLDLLFGGRE